MNTFRIYKWGSGGGGGGGANEILKKSNEMEDFPLFFVFGMAP